MVIIRRNIFGAQRPGIIPQHDMITCRTLVIRLSLNTEVSKKITTVKSTLSFLSLITGISFSSVCLSQQLPLWELGVGFGALHLPYYRGSDTTTNFVIPFPYLVYRGDRFNIDESGVHQRLFKSDNVKLELSLAGGVPVASGDTKSVRNGMPDLDPTVEIGPSLEIRLWENNINQRSLMLNLPLRATASVSTSKIDHQGYSFSPYLEYVLRSRTPGSWKVGLAFGPLYADEEYHNYFYEVEPEFATPSRPEYHSEGGYSGSRITLTVQKNIADVWLGAFLRYDSLREAAFQDSPLVTSDYYHAFGFAVTWVFAKSKTLVKVD